MEVDTFQVGLFTQRNAQDPGKGDRRWGAGEGEEGKVSPETASQPFSQSNILYLPWTHSITNSICNDVSVVLVVS